MRANQSAAIVRAFRDLAVVDREDRNCGIVDDVEVAEVEPGIWELKALFIGPGAWARRRPRWLTRWFANHRMVRIEAADVASATSNVRLARNATELGLARIERALLTRCSGAN